jgi:hypothetical protein
VIVQIFVAQSQATRPLPPERGRGVRHPPGDRLKRERPRRTLCSHNGCLRVLE